MPSKNRKQQQQQQQQQVQQQRSNNHKPLLHQSSSDNSISSTFCNSLDRKGGIGGGCGSSEINYGQLSKSCSLTNGNGSRNSIGINGESTSQLTTKEQQQLDRNNYLFGLTKEQLKIECRKRGQKLTGNKNQLVHINN